MEEFNSDDYLQQRQKQSKIPHNFFQVKMLVVVLVLGAFFYVAWYAYDRLERVDDSMLPLITASSKIIKSKPEKPGGLVIANSDKDIYNDMSVASVKKVKKEKAIAPPVSPASKQVIVQTIEQELKITAEPKKEEPKTDFIVSSKLQPQSATIELTELDKELNTLDNVDKQVEVVTQSLLTAPSEVKLVELGTDEISTNASKVPHDQGQLVIKPEDVPVQTAEALLGESTLGSSQKAYTIRIAALRNEESAIAAWKSLRTTFAVLRNLGSEIYITNQDGRTVYYLHAGPVATKEQAEQICRAMQEHGRRCRVY